MYPISDEDKKDWKAMQTEYYTPTLNTKLNDIIKIKSSFKHTIFIQSTNSGIAFYGSGSNSKGALGTGSDEYLSTHPLINLTKHWNLTETEKNFKKIRVGWNNTLVLTEGKNSLLNSF